MNHVKEAFENGVNGRVVMVVVIRAIPYTAAKGKTVGAKLLSDISFVRIRVIIVEIPKGREFGGCGCRGAVAKIAGIVSRINNFSDVATTTGACEAMLVSIPFMRARMAENDIAASGRIEVAIMGGVLGSHLRLSALVGCQGAQTKANSETGETKRAGRQPDGSSRSECCLKTAAVGLWIGSILGAS